MSGLTFISFLLRIFWNYLLCWVNVCWRNRRKGTWGSESLEAYRGELAHFINFFSLSALISFRRISLHVENKQHCTTGFSSQTHAKHDYDCLDKNPFAILRSYLFWRFEKYAGIYWEQVNRIRILKAGWETSHLIELSSCNSTERFILMYSNRSWLDKLYK